MTTAGRSDTNVPGLTTDSSVEAVQALYDRWARFYNWNPVLDLVRSARRRAVAGMDLSRGDTVVDMGTGTGANLPPLRRAVGPDGAVIGIDVSPGMLGRARELVDAEGWENVRLIEADIREPPVHGPVDGIISAFVVVMYAEPEPFIEAWAQFLESGAMAHLYAGRSSRRYAPVVNRLLNLYLRLFEEGWGTGDDGPLDILEDRGERVRSAMARSAEQVEQDDLVFGLAQLDVARFE